MHITSSTHRQVLVHTRQVLVLNSDTAHNSATHGLAHFRRDSDAWCFVHVHSHHCPLRDRIIVTMDFVEDSCVQQRLPLACVNRDIPAWLHSKRLSDQFRLRAHAQLYQTNNNITIQHSKNKALHTKINHSSFTL